MPATGFSEQEKQHSACGETQGTQRLCRRFLCASVSLSAVCQSILLKKTPEKARQPVFRAKRGMQVIAGMVSPRCPILRNRILGDYGSPLPQNANKARNRKSLCTATRLAATTPFTLRREILAR